MQRNRFAAFSSSRRALTRCAGTSVLSLGVVTGVAMPVLAGVPIENPIPAPIGAGTVHVKLTPLASGFAAPNWAINAPGHADRLFVVDQTGQIWNVDVATGEQEPFLDLSSRLVPLGISGPGSYDERGLLGVAFHPDYLKNGLLYTYTSEPVNAPADFTTMPRGVLPNHQDVVVEWQVPTPNVRTATVDPNSARVLFRGDHPQFNHNGGAMHFGPDGYLYIAIGDGGAGDDQGVGHLPGGNGQSVNTILGKVLRIDPLGTNSANGEYGIPVDNPFAGDTPGVDEIFALGFRNPFRMSFELGGKQELYVADVGQNEIEEFGVASLGENHGWPVKEGTFLFDANGGGPGFVFADSPGVPATMTDPIAQYDHDEGVAIIGGFVYEGSKIPALAGHYVFGDLQQESIESGRLFHVPADGGTIVEFNLIGQETLGLALLGFGRDAAGELYVLANSTVTPSGTTGVVLRIEPLSGDFDGNGIVNGADLAVLLGAWGPCRGACAEDLDGDGSVGAADLAILLGAWNG